MHHTTSPLGIKSSFSIALICTFFNCLEVYKSLDSGERQYAPTT